MLEYLITFLCLNLDPQYNAACVNTLNATTISIDLKSNVELLQQNIEKKIVKETGDKVWLITLTAYDMFYREQLHLTTDFKPIADNISGTMNRQSTIVTLTWVY